MKMSGKSLHQLAESNETEELKAALLESVESINAYATHQALRGAVYRHGLKGTPLHVAVISNRVEAAKLLIEFGADPSLNVMQFERGYDEVPDTTPLNLAKRLNLPKMFKVLNNAND